MQIFVRIPSGKVVIVDINDLDMKAIDIKKYIMSKYPFDSETHDLIYNGSILKDDVTVSKAEIKPESNLRLVAKKIPEKSIDPDTITITIFASSKGSFNIDVKKDDKISKVKGIIETKVGNQIELHHEGQKLDNHRTVEQCNITHCTSLIAEIMVDGGFN